MLNNLPLTKNARGEVSCCGLSFSARMSKIALKKKKRGGDNLCGEDAKREE